MRELVDAQKVRDTQATELTYSDGAKVLRSYEEVVAVFIPDIGAICTNEFFSRTTSQHINEFVRRCGAWKTRSNVNPSTLNEILKGF